MGSGIRVQWLWWLVFATSLIMLANSSTAAIAEELPAITTKPASSSTRTSATLSGTVNPNGSATTYQFEYGTTIEYGSKAPASPKSIGSGASPVKVSEKIEGLQPGTIYHFRLVATNAKGPNASSDQTFTTPTWEIQSTPNPEGAGASRLLDVSCEPSSISLCTAVGLSTGSEATSPLVQRWNGSSWSEQAPAKKSGAIYSGLFGVDCPSATRCIAVGSYEVSEGSAAPLAELWNEGKWSIQSTPVPSGATSSELLSVGCSSTAQCSAVGSAMISGVKTAIVERWTSPTWALQTVPIPSGAKSSQLDGVDCIWSGFCVAVGRYTTSGGATKALAMFWNGTTWSLQTLTDPAGAAASELLDVSCTKTPNVCTAVGSWENSAKDKFTLAYRFNGSSWALQNTPNPSGSTGSLLLGVSCATATSCTAVGTWVNQSGGSFDTLAEVWDGSSWSIQGTPNPPEATAGIFYGASCRGTSCLGVGWSANASGSETTLAEISDPSNQSPTITTKPASSSTRTSATLSGTVNPNGSATTYQFEYGTTIGYGSKAPASPKSIGSGVSPVEVSEKIEGLLPGTTYHFRLVATNAKGANASTDQTFTTPTWEIQSTPNAEGAIDSLLLDVSCEPSSTSLCTAVGLSRGSGGEGPLAQRWNGSSWSEQAPAKKSGTLPTRLFGVDCPSTTRCIAVGSYEASETSATVAELWNEGKWSVQSTPVPSGASSSELVAVGCNSTAQCRAAGSAVIGGVKTAIIEAWSSPNWTLQTVPIPEGAKSSQLDGIDCIWSSVCVAVGRYTTSGGSTKSLAMLWNGTTWSLQTLPDPAGAVKSELLDVSCTPSPTLCTVVGAWEELGWEGANGPFTLAYRFNGSSWALQNTPNPSGSTSSTLLGVSCATSTSCTAVGFGNGSGSADTLAQQWNGTNWSIQGTPNPSGAHSFLFGASCRGTSCLAVGWSANESGAETTLAEIR